MLQLFIEAAQNTPGGDDENKESSETDGDAFFESHTSEQQQESDAASEASSVSRAAKLSVSAREKIITEHLFSGSCLMSTIIMTIL